MNGLRIEHLQLSVPAMSPGDARRLALLVATGLAQASSSAGAGEIPSIRVAVTGAAATGSGDLDALAGRIVADALRQIRRTP